MYCINCRYYDRHSKTCINRDGIKRQSKDCNFCSYCEPISDIELSCENCVYYKNEMNDTGFCDTQYGLYQWVFKSDYCSSFTFNEKSRTPLKKREEKPKVGWLYKNEEIGYIILEKINRRGLCEAYNYDENGEKLTYTLGINSLGEPIFQVFKDKGDKNDI